MKKKMILTIVAFTVLLCPGFIHSAIPALERAALIALYNSTNGDNWTRNSSWKTPPLDTDGFAMPGTERSWNGITVTTDHVTKIQLICNKLNGRIPSELGNLSHIQTLSLFNSLDNQEYQNWNHLSGGIPHEFGALSNLQYLDLSSIQLSGSIPSELSNLSDLGHLDLNNNALSGGIPSQLGNLNNLSYLNLGENQLSGEIPLELDWLKKKSSLSD